MRVGDLIHATNNAHHITGRIVYGFSPALGEFTDIPGVEIDAKEVVAVATGDNDIPSVRLSQNAFMLDVWESSLFA